MTLQLTLQWQDAVFRKTISSSFHLRLLFNSFFFFFRVRRTPKNKKQVTDDSFKTPSLEEFGISSKTLQMLQGGKHEISPLSWHFATLKVAVFIM
jgi:hypothetical protein